MRFPNERELERLRAKYPPGTKIVLEKMDDPQSPPVGTIGTVWGVDDAGQIITDWQTGGCLSLIPGIDKFHIFEENVS